jgi:glycosyltransferase involved in cell wall biosynthesis
MRILVIDYSGHPFPVTLSRALARRGHETLHLYTGSSETPKGDLVRGPGDPECFDVRMEKLDEPFNKTNLVKRRSQERQIGRLFSRAIEEYRPDLILAGNCPIETLRFIFQSRDKIGAQIIFWVQDLLGEAATRLLSKKLGLPGKLVGLYFQWLEKRMLQSSDHVVVISEDFRPILQDGYGIPADGITVIENWSPIDDLPLYPRDNEWAVQNLPASDFRVMYSGTLGLKQDPGLLLEIASRIDCEVMVFSQGDAARSLAAEAAARGIANLSVRPWLDFADLPKALAGADMLVVVLEPDAGVFSVPSKCLTYLCAGKPILGSIDPSNLASRIINRIGAGVTAMPGDHTSLIAAAQAYRDDPARARAAGAAGRRYAEETFNVEVITDRFVGIFETLQARAGRSGGAAPAVSAPAPRQDAVADSGALLGESH